MSYAVVIPSCNRWDLLGLAVRSAAIQNPAPEVIVVADDASTDPRYGEMDAAFAGLPVACLRSGVNSRTRHGTTYANGAARNVALEAALGLDVEWIAFLDDDDVWLPGKMARQLSLATPGVAAIGSDCQVIDQAGQRTGRLGLDHGQQVRPGVIDVTDLVGHLNPLPNSSAVVRMAVARSVGLQVPSEPWEDWAYWRSVARHGRLWRVQEELAGYRKGHPTEWSL